MTFIKLAGGVEIEVLERDGAFLGLGGVSVGGVALRCAERPILVRVDTPEGILYTRLEVEGITESAEGAEVALGAIGLAWGRSEFLDDYGQSLQMLAPGNEPVTDKLTLRLRPESLELGLREWVGFSSSFEFASETRQIHRLQTQATWEIGGRITGNTVLSQGQCNMPVYRGSKEGLFTTACLRTLASYGSPQGYSFQLAPRGGLVQGFDFQYAPQGVLFQYWPEFDSISSLVESARGSDLLQVVDEYRFELGEHVQTLPKHVLFSAGELQEHEARNLWWAALEHVYSGIREQFGVTRTPVIPEVVMNYTTVMGGSQAEPCVRMKLADVEVDHGEVLGAIAEHLLPRLAEQGVRRFFPEVVSESDVTVLGLKRKLDDGVHGDLHCSSVCATHRFFPSEFWGGIAGWRTLYEKAQTLGIELGHWFAPHFSPRSPLFEEHPEYRMIDALGMPAGGGYGFQTIAVADWNTGIYQRTLDDLKRWKEEGGLDYLFIDSYSNLGLLQTNYSAAMRTNYRAFARLLAELQGIGIRAFSFESISPFGISRFGVTDLRNDLLEQDRSVAGQNDFGWWYDEEDMAIDCCLVVHARKREIADLQRSQFRAMANRGHLVFWGFYDLDHILPGWWARANKVYNLVLPHMTERTLLANRAGVRWSDGATEVWWLFRDAPLVTGRRVERVTEDGFVPVEGEKLEAWQVYRSLGAGQ